MLQVGGVERLFSSHQCLLLCIWLGSKTSVTKNEKAPGLPKATF